MRVNCLLQQSPTTDCFLLTGDEYFNAKYNERKNIFKLHKNHKLFD